MIDSGVATSHVVIPRAWRISPVPLIVLIVGSMLVGATAMWAVTPDRGVQVARGTVTGVNADVSVIGFLADGKTSPARRRLGVLNDGEMMSVLAGVAWTDTEGVVHHDSPIACMAPGSRGQRVELGTVEYPVGTGSRTAKIVVSVRCLAP